MSEIKSSPSAKNQMVFGKRNYILFIASILVVAIGFFLMAGSEDIYSFTKIRLAPFIVVAGFALGIVSILVKPTKEA
jgi:peptidoglycan/LPS O-acetylase OafA/YrhL